MQVQFPFCTLLVLFCVLFFFCCVLGAQFVICLQRGTWFKIVMFEVFFFRCCVFYCVFFFLPFAGSLDEPEQDDEALDAAVLRCRERIFEILRQKITRRDQETQGTDTSHMCHSPYSRRVFYHPTNSHQYFMAHKYTQTHTLLAFLSFLVALRHVEPWSFSTQQASVLKALAITPYVQYSQKKCRYALLPLGVWLPACVDNPVFC